VSNFVQTPLGHRSREILGAVYLILFICEQFGTVPAPASTQHVLVACRARAAAGDAGDRGVMAGANASRLTPHGVIHAGVARKPRHRRRKSEPVMFERALAAGAGSSFAGSLTCVTTKAFSHAARSCYECFVLFENCGCRPGLRRPDLTEACHFAR
jgi:hypothetical protein